MNAQLGASADGKQTELLSKVLETQLAAERTSESLNSVKVSHESAAQNVDYLVELVSTVIADQTLVKETVKDLNGIKATHEGAIYNTVRLTEICSDLRRSLEKDQHVSTERHCSLLETLGQIKRRQWRVFEMLPLAVRELAVYIDRVKLVVEQLLSMVGKFSVEALKLLKRILETDLEIYALLRQVQERLPRGPPEATHDCIHFQDALGRTQELPYRYFRYWEVFESMLKCEFRHLPGERHVLQGQYHLLYAKRRRHVITKKEWEASVFPDSSIDQTMVVAGHRFRRGICPRPACGQENPLVSDHSTTINW